MSPAFAQAPPFKIANLNGRIVYTSAFGSTSTGGIQEALAALPASGGKVVVDAPATLTTRVLISGRSNIEIECTEGTTVTQSTAATDSIDIINSSQIWIHGCALSGPGTGWGDTIDVGYDSVGAVAGDNNFIRISDNQFTNSAANGIFVYPSSITGTSHIWIQNNQFIDNTSTVVDTADVSLYASAANNYPINYFWVTDNRMRSTGAQQNYHGVLVLENCHNGVIEGNIISGKFWHGIVLTNEANTTWTAPDNSNIIIAHNQVSGCGRVGIYVQSPGEGIVVAGNLTTANSSAPASGLEGGILILGGEGDATVNVTGNTSYLDDCEGLKIVASSLSGAGAPPKGGLSVNLTGESILSPNQGSCGSQGGLVIALSGTTNYLGRINVSGLLLRGDGTHGAGLQLVTSGATSLGWKGATFGNCFLDLSDYSFSGISGITNIRVLGGEVLNATGDGIFADTIDGFAVRGVEIRDWNTTSGTGGAVALNTNVTHYDVTGNTIVQDLTGGSPTEYGIDIDNASDQNGIVAGNFIASARTASYHLVGTTGLLRGANADAAVNSVTFSAAPAFDASLGNTQKITLTGNVTSSTLTNAVAGEKINFEVCQDATGSRTFVWPTNVKGAMTIGSTALKCSAQSFVFDGTSAYALGAGSSNM